MALTIARLYEQVQRQALTDSLTDAYNRRYPNDFLTQELKRCGRDGNGVSLVMLDPDRFEDYKAASGQPAGDEALRELADLLR